MVMYLVKALEASVQVVLAGVLGHVERLFFHAETGATHSVRNSAYDGAEVRVYPVLGVTCNSQNTHHFYNQPNPGF
jgi:hypothetical protein